MRLRKDFDPMVILLSTDESFLNWFYFNTPILDNILMTRDLVQTRLLRTDNTLMIGSTNSLRF